VWDEESGELHRELENFAGQPVSALASFLSPDGQQSRLVAGSTKGHLGVYDPEAGSVLHHLEGHRNKITGLACIASSSAVPHHPRLVSVSGDRTAKVWDGETGEMRADLRGHTGPVTSVTVWKEHTGEGEHDRIATAGHDGRLKVWDGEALTLLRDLRCGLPGPALPLQTVEGPHRLLLGIESGRGLQVWDPEEGRLLHEGINRGRVSSHFHLFESAEGRYLMATVSRGTQHSRHPGDTERPFLDVWDLGEAPAATAHVRPANKHG
jgi:WD40 repeat protein